VGATLTNVGLLQNLTGAAISNFGDFDNHADAIVVNDGEIDTGTGLFSNSGTLGGAGLQMGNLNDAGTLSPGNSAGVYTIDGVWNKTGGRLEIELGGLFDGGGDKSLTQHDWVDVTGNVNFTGSATVELSFLTPFGESDLNIGDRFDVVRFSRALTGVDNLTLDDSQAPLMAGLSWQLLVDTQSLFLEVTNLPLWGDANNDGQVTGADLIAVQANFGGSGPADGLLFGDANDDGKVTGADLINVQQNFGNTFGPVSAEVPEPTSACLLA